MTDKKCIGQSPTGMNKKDKSDLGNSKKPVHKVVGRVLTGVLTLIFLFALVTLIALFVQISQGKQPSFFGYRLYVIMTDSMTPALNVNDVIIGKTVHFDNPEDTAHIVAGSIITFTAAYGDQKGMSITHRVIESSHFDEEYSRYVVTTQGTKSGATVDKPVPIENINAIMTRKSNVITALYSVISSASGLLILLSVPMGFIIIMLIVRLIGIIRAPITKDDLSAEREKEQAERASREKEIAERAVLDYIQSKNQKRTCEYTREPQTKKDADCASDPSVSSTVPSDKK